MDELNQTNRVWCCSPRHGQITKRKTEFGPLTLLWLLAWITYDLLEYFNFQVYLINDTSGSKLTPHPI